MRRRVMRVMVLMAVMSGLLTGAAAPSRADEPAPDVAVVAGTGSATLDQIDRSLASSLRIGGQAVMASYGTTGPSPMNPSETGDPACSMSRPQNDSDGLVALLTSIRNGTGCVDFARMSGRTGLNQPSDVNLTYVPFAEDGFTFAVTNTSLLPRQMSWVDLRDVYRCVLTGYRPMLPAYGSQLRAQWLAYLQIPATDVDLGHFPCIVDSVSGVPVVENDGRVLDNSSVVPFSLASWQAQAGGLTPDVRGRAVPGWITGSPGFSSPPLSRNTADYQDGLTFVVSNTSSIARQLTLADLHDIYTCRAPDTTLKPSLPADTTSTTRSAWLAKLGIAEADVQAGAYPCIKTVSPSGQTIVDNDVRFVEGSSIVPLAIDEFQRQTFGISADRRGNGLLGTIVRTDGRKPLPIRIADSVQFPVAHLVYHVLPTLPEMSSPWRQLFLGVDSLVCTSALIVESGFRTIGTDGANPCGIPDLETGPAETTSRTSYKYSSMAQPTSNNGVYQEARFGRCAIRGRYINDGDMLIVDSMTAGPDCWARVETVAWNYDNYQMERYQEEYWHPKRFDPQVPVFMPGGTWNLKQGRVVESVVFVIGDYGYVGSSSVVIFGPPKNWTTQSDCPRVEPSTDTSPVKRFKDKSGDSHLLGCDRLVHIEEGHTYMPLTWFWNDTDWCISNAMQVGTRTQSASNVNNWQWTWTYDVRLRNGSRTTNTAVVIERKSDRQVVTAYTLQSDQDYAQQSTQSGGTVGDWWHCRNGVTASTQSIVGPIPPL